MAQQRKIPHTYVIIFYIILIASVMTWFIPGGEYIEKVVDGHSTQVFQRVESQPQTWHVFAALFKGFERQSGIIVFILLIGGAFWIMNHTKAMDVAILSFLKFTTRLEKYSFIRFLGVNNIIITLIMIMFSIFGAVFGMSEETIAFIIILVPLSISMGYDSIVGVCMVFVAAGLGFAGAVLNPFTVGIAQGLSEIPLYSGSEYRIFMWFVITFFGIFWVLRYASKIHKNPQKSPVYETDAYWRSKQADESEKINYHTPKTAWFVYAAITIFLILYSLIPVLSEHINRNDILVHPSTKKIFGIPFVISQLMIGNVVKEILIFPILTLIFAVLGFYSLRKSVHFFILILLLFTIIFLIVGVMGYNWYIMEIATLFFAMGIFTGLSMGYIPSKITTLFLDGVRDILSAAVVVGLAGGIIVILEDGKVIGSILYGMSKSMYGFGQITTVSIMYVIQTMINIVIPSGSAKAALTMPIMAPFSDLIGLSRQATVVAFQLGDGFTNMITPTSGVLIAVLGVAKIPYERWVKWVTPFIIILVILGFLLLIPTVTMNLNGF